MLGGKFLGGLSLRSITLLLPVAAAVCLISSSATAQVVFGPTSLPDARVGEAYSQTLTASQGSISASPMIPGMALSASTLSGTPTAPGTYAIAAMASYSECVPSPPLPGCTWMPRTASHTYSLTVLPAVTPVPTLGEWTMILLGLGLAGGAAVTLQRRLKAG